MALSFATTFPDKVENLLLLCPGGLASEKASFLWKAIFFSLLGKWGQQQTLKLVGGGVISSATGSESSLEFSTLTFKHFRPRTAKMPILSNQALSKLTMPILMLFGDSDQLIPADKSVKRLIEFAPQTKIELLPNTGHLIVNQTELIINFLNQKISK